MTAKLALALALVPLTAFAQSSDPKPSDSDCSKLATRSEVHDCADRRAEVRTIDLKNVSTQNDADEILRAIRNTFEPGMQVYLVNGQNIIAVRTYPEEFARIEAIVHSLDRPHKTYRLTYTITEFDGGKPVGTEHLAMVIVDGQHTTVKEGDKIPVATGSYTTDNNSSQTQFTYLDVGMNIDSTLTEYDNGALLKAKVEQSSIGPTNTIAGVQEPVVRQTVLEGISFLTLGKPIMLGSIDVPNTTRRLDIAVVLDPIK
jgi:type II secretory pathway component GspD/PulD (secretin)